MLADAHGLRRRRSSTPPSLVDIATLTGAMKVALGQRTGGSSPTTRPWPPPATPRGETSGEPLWRMPLVGRLRGQARPPRSPTPTTPRRRGRDHRGPVPPALRRRRAVGPPRLRLGRRLADGLARVDRRTHRLRRPRPADLARLRGAGRPRPVSRAARAHRPLVAGRRARRASRRRSPTTSPRPRYARFTAHGRPGLQDLADACRGSGSRAATSSPTTRPRGVPGDLHRRRRRRPGLADHRQPRRS